MKLFVANTTKQIQEIQYRVPENPKIIVETIPVGQQRRVFKEDATKGEIDAIIRQLEIYGAIRVVDRPRDFNGLVYSIDKPVPSDTMETVVGHNDDVLEQRGFDLRQAAAVAVASDAGIQDGRGLNQLEVSIREENKPGDAPDADKMNQTTSVMRDGEKPTSRGRGKRK